MSDSWEYRVQLKEDVRLYYRPQEQGGYVERRGTVWEVVRTTKPGDGSHYYQTVVCSPGVFEDDDEAKRDALEKLSMLRCPLGRPLDRAIKWMLDDG
ncbi:MAG: hypothetical protein F4Y03_09825 [Alphaproteobacteria bacterium]|nr:hypothetical protein [Alphaproteobacteria bacterium]